MDEEDQEGNPLEIRHVETLFLSGLLKGESAGKAEAFHEGRAAGQAGVAEAPDATTVFHVAGGHGGKANF